LKSLTKVIAGQVPVKAVIKVQAKPFADTLVQLRNYVFGTMTGLTVVCTQAKTPGYVLLSLDVQQGKVESAMPAVLSTDFRYVWQLAKLCPWVEYIAGVDPDAMISCGQKDGCHAFSAGKRVLIVAETA
jgi:hypothetical protein